MANASQFHSNGTFVEVYTGQVIAYFIVPDDGYTNTASSKSVSYELSTATSIDPSSTIYK